MARISYLDRVEYNDNFSILIRCPENFEGAYEVPDCVSCIAERAFENCEGLTALSIPNSVTIIGDDAFDGCTHLASIDVVVENPNYCSIDGVLFSKDQTTLIKYPNGKNTSQYIIPNGVITIYSGAFGACTHLNSIQFSSSVREIAFCAFSGCKNMESINMNHGLSSIGSGAFMGCKNITNINIPDGVTQIWEDTFSGCGNLLSITLPCSVRQISPRAFMDCSRLTTIVVDDNNSSYCSIDGVLFCKRPYILLHYPAGKGKKYEIPSDVQAIWYYAFCGCDKLVTIRIPNSVTSIENYAFDGCTGLTSVTIPNSVTSIGNWAFEGCSCLREIIVPHGQKARFAQMEGLRDLAEIIIEK